MMTNQTPEHQKEEKLAAARLKLKEFKKRNEPSNGTGPHNDNTESGRSSPASVHSSHSTHSKFLNLTSLNEAQLNFQQVKEQLQLHVQTIGILVAEKAELQSKLQQQSKKCDKKQDECDELMGRLKASRQKITDLERLVHQLSQEPEKEEKSQDVNLINELNTKDLVIDEFKIKLNEMNEKLNMKSSECQKFAQLTLDLKSQLEILQLKLSQEDAAVESTDELKVENSNLKVEVAQLKGLLEQQKSELKQEYQSYVERLQKQIENLVDQINRLTDEREESFLKLDTLSAKVKHVEEENLSLRTRQQIVEVVKPDTSKLDLLENEVKYFKQQIEILLHEQASLNEILKDKTLEIENLSKLIEKYESDRQNYNHILEQSHNDKQTISRILKQNNDLKSQLEELETVYVKVTNDNLDLTTRLQSLSFTKSVEPSPEWDDEVVEKVEASKLEQPEEHKESLLDSVKKRMNDLEKENKDLNDYILLSNQKLNEHVNLIAELSTKIKSLESGQSVPSDYLANMKLVETKFKKVMEDNAELKEKNQELEHIIQQLQFETESIVDYITMYQMERSKLNEKYKIKDEAIRSLSTQLQVNKLALLEINNFLNAFIKLYQEEGDESKQKREFVLMQIQSLLANLTQTSSNQLIQVETSTHLSRAPVLRTSTSQTQEHLEKSIAKFRTETIVCSQCYGDLFIV